MHSKYIFLLVILLSSTFIQAQNLSYSEKSNMVSSSYQVKLNSTVVDLAKKYASENEYQYKIIEKNFIHLRVIYNEKLDAKKRIAYGKYLLDLWEHDKGSLPDGIIRQQIKNLQTKNSKND